MAQRIPPLTQFSGVVEFAPALFTQVRQSAQSTRRAAKERLECIKILFKANNCARVLPLPLILQLCDASYYNNYAKSYEETDEYFL